MPKTSSADRINAAFEEIGEALNNPKLREGFLNGNKENEIISELVEMFDKQNKKEELLNVECSHKKVTHRSEHIAHVPPRVNQTSVPETNAAGPPRVSPSPVPNNQKTNKPIEHVPPRKLFNDSSRHHHFVIQSMEE